jgi:hypothetical protein
MPPNKGSPIGAAVVLLPSSAQCRTWWDMNVGVDYTWDDINQTHLTQTWLAVSNASLVRWGIEDTVDLDDIVVEQALNLEHGTRWIRRVAPKFCLYLAYERCEAV